jgi:putative hydrolase of the HAD superfamily
MAQAAVAVLITFHSQLSTLWSNYPNKAYFCLSMKKVYQHVFFDLDHTIWDFEKSAYHTFELLFKKHQLRSRGVPSLSQFVEVYTHHNLILWEAYRHGQLEKEVLRSLRFENSLAVFGISDKALATAMGEDYIYHSPRTVHLMPGTLESLDYLAGKYKLHLITNGFEEVQHIKISEARLGKYFQTVTTSEEAGVKKPDIQIFNYALAKAAALADHSIMVGDNLEVDILGAKLAGLDQVYFNPLGLSHNEVVTSEIRQLQELSDIL